MTTRRALAAVPLAVAAAIVPVTPAVAAPAAAPVIESRDVAGTVHFNGTTATVSGRYRCSPSVLGTHVWVSAKQGRGDLTVPDSSAISTAWFDTNGQPEAELTCDGRWQTLTAVLTAKKGTALTPGRTWIQFCLYAVTESGFSGASTMRYGAVQVAPTG